MSSGGPGRPPEGVVLGRLRALLGPLQVERDPDGLPRATPHTADALALVCRVAHEEGWKVRVEGQGTWLPADAPADLAVSTRALDQVVAVSPADLVATVQAGAPLDAVRRRLADHGMWLALDPPGRPERSIGSVLATATAGPLRLGFGPVRDHVLGCTVATGDGRVVQAGARVVKNVAGYDLTKLQIGGFGGFGIITEVHLRLRALPRADATWVARGPRDALTYAGRALAEAGVAPAALELLSPALAAESEWVLAARFMGTDEAAQAEAARLPAATDVVWQQLPAERSGAFWGLAARAALGGPVTFRMGVLADGLDDTLDLVAHDLDEGLVSAGAAGGMLRWTGVASPERLRALRRTAAGREIPLTLERAPWPVRHAVGHFGAYREGVGRLVGRLRETFDPGQCLSVALEGVEG
ncbi:MAG TPA: FAD-binding oxidoreductase [Gemmatimonadales bacterium]|nr:FAD-binding oxidoreductase [Gemmatimonadales bacterium]